MPPIRPAVPGTPVSLLAVITDAATPNFNKSEAIYTNALQVDLRKMVLGQKANVAMLPTTTIPVNGTAVIELPSFLLERRIYVLSNPQVDADNSVIFTVNTFAGDVQYTAMNGSVSLTGKSITEKENPGESR